MQSRRVLVIAEDWTSPAACCNPTPGSYIAADVLAARDMAAWLG
jgi:hypothetical protein